VNSGPRPRHCYRPFDAVPAVKYPLLKTAGDSHAGQPLIAETVKSRRSAAVPMTFDPDEIVTLGGAPMTLRIAVVKVRAIPRLDIGRWPR
jgi:hypothetical protein